jgi:hypothetical protein
MLCVGGTNISVASRLVLRSQLAANVEEVVAHFVQGVYRDPAQRPLMGLWVVVDAATAK